jgi:hypothetical protein
LEHAKAPPLTPFEVAYGSLEAFAAAAQGFIDGGVLDPRDGPVLVASIRRWHGERLWDGHG